MGKTYIVEKIIDKRIRKNKAEYLLRWKGFDETHDEWIPEDQLNCFQLLFEFEKTQVRSKRCREPDIDQNDNKKRKIAPRKTRITKKKDLFPKKGPIFDDVTFGDGLSETDTNGPSIQYSSQAGSLFANDLGASGHFEGMYRQII